MEIEVSAAECKIMMTRLFHHWCRTPDGAIGMMGYAQNKRYRRKKEAESLVIWSGCGEQTGGRAQ
jgi:hypothetical protein